MSRYGYKCDFIIGIRSEALEANYCLDFLRFFFVLKLSLFPPQDHLLPPCNPVKGLVWERFMQKPYVLLQWTRGGRI